MEDLGPREDKLDGEAALTVDPVLRGIHRWERRCAMGFLLALLVLDILFVLILILIKFCKLVWGQQW